MRIGIIRETKIPKDRRVPLTPSNCSEIIREFPGVKVVVQPDKQRAFSDDEYRSAGIELREDMRECDVLMGVKEVAIETLIPGKTYLFFSHTAKKQTHNRELLKAIIKKKITLIDYEYLTESDNTRLAAFGRWAGIVGAYNGLRAYGRRYNKFMLKPAWKCRDKQEVFSQLNYLNVSNIKILITGGGRVAKGAEEVLTLAGIRKVSSEEYLAQEFSEAVYAQIDPWHYVKRKDGKEFGLDHFFSFPGEYVSTFLPFTGTTDMFIPCHFWDPGSPAFMTREIMNRPGFRISIIADVSCDVNGPLPSTIRVSTIADPFYGYDPSSGKETFPFKSNSITVMAVDNLPGELPRDASEDFSRNLKEKVLPSLSCSEPVEIITRATIARDGKLTKEFAYLEDFLRENE